MFNNVFSFAWFWLKTFENVVVVCGLVVRTVENKQKQQKIHIENNGIFLFVTFFPLSYFICTQNRFGRNEKICKTKID